MNNSTDPLGFEKKNQFAKKLKSRLQDLVKSSSALLKNNELQRLEFEKQKEEQQEIERQLQAQEKKKKIEYDEQQLTLKKEKMFEEKRRIDAVEQKDLDHSCYGVSICLLILSAIPFIIGSYHFVRFTYFNHENYQIEIRNKDAELRQVIEDGGIIGKIFGDSKVDKLTGEIAEIWCWITIPMGIFCIFFFIGGLLYMSTKDSIKKIKNK